MEARWKKWLTNKYIVVFSIFLIWMLFFDKNNLIVQWKLHHQLKKLHQEETFYKNEIEKNNALYYELQKYPERYIKFIREKYMVKKDNEDIFLLIYEKSPTLQK